MTTKTKYRAVCDKHGESINLLVLGHSVGVSLANLTDSDGDIAIQEWLEKHYSCDMRLVWRDEQLEALLNQGYRRVGNDDLGLHTKRVRQ